MFLPELCQGSVATVLELLAGRATHGRHVTSGAYLALQILCDFFPASLCNIAQLLPVAQIRTPNISSLMLPLNSHSFFFSIWNALFFKSFRTRFQFLFLHELVSNSPMRENPIFIYISTSAANSFQPVSHHPYLYTSSPPWLCALDSREFV